MRLYYPGHVTVPKNEALGIMNALRGGVVPARGLHHYAVGLEREMGVLRDQLQEVADGHSHVKGVRGAYGSGKTFVISRLAEEALSRNFVVSKVTLNRDAYSLHMLERLYQGVMQNLAVRGTEGGALPYLLDRWLDDAEEYAVTVRGIPEDDETALRTAVDRRIQDLLGEIAQERPSFAAALSAYYGAHLARDHALKRQIVGWLMADPNTSAREIAKVKGSVARTDAVAYLSEFVRMMRHVGRSGLVIILDELDEMRKLRRNLRESAWANLRDLVDRVGAGVPGLYLVLAGTPDVFDAPRGFPDLTPLAQRFEDRTLGSPFPNLRGPQLPLPRFGEAQLVEAMERLQAIWEVAYDQKSRLPAGFAEELARGWTAKLGDRSPRVAIREFVGILDRLRDYPEYDPRRDYGFDAAGLEFTPEERGAEDLAPEDVF